MIVIFLLLFFSNHIAYASQIQTPSHIPIAISFTGNSLRQPNAGSNIIHILDLSKQLAIVACEKLTWKNILLSLSAISLLMWVIIARKKFLEIFENPLYVLLSHLSEEDYYALIQCNKNHCDIQQDLFDKILLYKKIKSLISYKNIIATKLYTLFYCDSHNEINTIHEKLNNIIQKTILFYKNQQSVEK